MERGRRQQLVASLCSGVLYAMKEKNEEWEDADADAVEYGIYKRLKSRF